ncbi:DUF2911 domain-containing protein [uncultured Aquimarina sp.]|uniref:DUF2911 domain-containing protein n=1 Tax=uncultured Aquimarina sp. TaxID=575652 RepID=UPI00260EEC76|nr:DUF2911 domain-containing protein [uncultured Aquimarina sp.]
MKKLILLVLGIVLTSCLTAQSTTIKAPKLSPFQKTQTKIGIVDVSLEYSRPSMRGRKIFGDLEPFDKIWRTGANKNTKITFSDYVVIENVQLTPGTYTIFTKPNPDTWDIYFHTELDEYGVPDIVKPENIVAKVTVPTFKLNKDVETLSITFDNMTGNSAMLGIAWERTYVSVLIQIPTDKILKKILKEDKISLAKKYATSAYIYFDLEKDNKKALEAINNSISIRENGITFEELLKTADLRDKGLLANYSMKSEILIDLNKKEEALKYANRSLIIANKISNEWWIKHNTKNIKDWSND